MHAAGDVSEGNSLVDPVLEEGDCPVAGIVQDAESGRWLLALAPVAEDGPGLEAVLIDADELERPDVPVDAAGRVLPEG